MAKPVAHKAEPTIKLEGEKRVEEAVEKSKHEPMLEIAPGETPLESYEKENEQPYVLDCLELDRPFFSVEEGEERENLELIDRFIKEDLESRRWRPNIGNYKKVFETVKGSLGISEDDSPEMVVKQLGTLLRVLENIKQGKVKKVRRKLLNELIGISRGEELDKPGMQLWLEEQYIKLQNEY